jgi:hypothetical protein
MAKDPEDKKEEGHEYKFDGFEVVLSEKIALTPVGGKG